MYNYCVVVVVVVYSDSSLRDLILRGCRKIWSVCSVVDKKKEAVPSDPLEDIYCSTLKKRLLSDLMVAIVVFVVTVSLSISTVFCRSIVSLLSQDYREERGGGVGEGGEGGGRGRGGGRL